MLKALIAPLLAATLGTLNAGEKKEKEGAEARRPPTPEQAYKKRMARKRRTAQKKARRRNGK